MTQKTQAFFIDDKCYMDTEDFIQDRFAGDEEEIKELSDDWYEDIQYGQLEPLFDPDKNFIDEIVSRCYELFEDRFPEDDPHQSVHNKLLAAITNGIDLDKIKNELPKLWYPDENSFGKITKQDLLDAI